MNREQQPTNRPRDNWRKEVFEAVSSNNTNALQAALMIRQELVDINTKDYTLDFSYLISVGVGAACIIMNTVQYGVDVYGTPVTEAISNGHTEVLNLLLREGASANYTQSDSSPLGLACRLGNLDIVQLLLQYGANIHTTLFWQTSAFTEAVQKHDVKIVALLLENGAMSPSAHNKQIRGMWAAAIWSKDTKILELLINNTNTIGLDIPSKYILSENLSRSNFHNIEMLIWQGIFPMDSAGIKRCFHKAVSEGSTKGIDTLLAIFPMLIQLFRTSQMPRTNVNVDALRKAMMVCPSLQAQCKSHIITSEGQHYMQKVNQLPLPKLMKTYLQSVQSEFDVDSFKLPGL